MTATTQNTLAAFKAAQQSPIDDPAFAGMLAKSTFAESGSPTTGLTFFDLEPGAKMLVPVLTPLRNDVPRVTGKGGIQANWKAITGLNTASVRAGISPGNRGGVIAVTTQDYNAVYKGIGLEANVDFEAVYAGQGFDDLRALAAQTLLESLMLQEEQIILGGNGSLALGTTPTPALTASSSGGSLATGTVSVIEPDLTSEGDPGDALPVALDAHGMNPVAVLAMVRDLGGDLNEVLVVGCQPAVLDEGIGLSPPVAAAVDVAAGVVRDLIDRAPAGGALNKEGTR